MLTKKELSNGKKEQQGISEMHLFLEGGKSHHVFISIGDDPSYIYTFGVWSGVISFIHPSCPRGIVQFFYPVCLQR
jgi:hypothetical protein